MRSNEGNIWQWKPKSETISPKLLCFAHASPNTIKRGMKEITAGALYHPGERIREKGGGVAFRAPRRIQPFCQIYRRCWSGSRGPHEPRPVDEQVACPPGEG